MCKSRLNADELLKSLLENKSNCASCGVLLNDLLEEFYRGYPLKNLVKIAHSHDVEVIKAAAWLLSELREESHLILPKVKHLINSDNKTIRFLMIRYLMSSDEIDTLIEVTHFLNDSELSNRWMVFDSLVHMKDSTIKACAQKISMHDKLSAFSIGFEILQKKHDSDTLIELLNEIELKDKILRKFIFATCLRNGLDEVCLLKYAENICDTDLVQFLET